MKYLLLISLTLFLLSCKESNDGFETFYKWNNVNEIVNRDSLINELGFELDLYDGIIINEVNYNLFGDEELFNHIISAYFKNDNNENYVSSFSLNYDYITNEYNNYFFEYSYFKNENELTNVKFINNGINVSINLENEFKNYSIFTDTINSDINLRFSKYDYDYSSIYLAHIVKINPFDMKSPNKTLEFFNSSDFTLLYDNIKAEIEKYYTLNDEIGFVFDSYHVKYNVIEKEGKKYLVLNKEIYPLRLRYLPE